MKELEKILKYEFKDKGLLDKALTHSSYVKENSIACENNERLEFIGDALLDAIVGRNLYDRLADVPEGELTKKRALIVCEKSLSVVARDLNIGRFIKIGPGMQGQGGRENDSILADAVESIIGAIWIDGGYSASEDFVLRHFKTQIEKSISGELFDDYKSKLQELLQKNQKNVVIQYILDRESGPSHDKTFYIHVEENGKVLGRGVGKSKKEAEQLSAKEAVNTLYKENK